MDKQKVLKILKKSLKITLIVIISFVLAITVAIKLFYFWYSYPKYDEKETAKFEEYKAEFEAINDYIIENFDCDEMNSILVCRDGEGEVYGDIISLYDNGDIELSDELQTYFNKIDDAFDGYDFSFVDVSKDRISYCGLGYRMYVYSRNGKAPDYYYYRGDGMHHETFKLTDNWYLLTVHFI